MPHPGIAVMLVVGVGLGAVLYYFFASSPEPPLSNRRQRSSPRSEPNRTWSSSPTEVRKRRLDPKCTICLEDTKKDDDVLIVPCKHVFHKLCIEEWRKNGHEDARQRCPLCRDRIESLEKLR